MLLPLSVSSWIVHAVVWQIIQVEKFQYCSLCHFHFVYVMFIRCCLVQRMRVIKLSMLKIHSIIVKRLVCAPLRCLLSPDISVSLERLFSTETKISKLEFLGFSRTEKNTYLMFSFVLFLCVTIFPYPPMKHHPTSVLLSRLISEKLLLLDIYCKKKNC